MVIVAAGAVYGCHCLSKTSDWSWLTEGKFTEEMWGVLGTTAVVELALLWFILRSRGQEEYDAEYLQFIKSGEDESTLPPTSVIKTLPPSLPLPVYYPPRGTRQPFPGQVHVYYHDPKTWKPKERAGDNLILDGPFPCAHSEFLGDKDKNITFAQLYEKMKRELAGTATLPTNYYFAILKKNSATREWNRWYRVENDHRIRDWTVTTPLGLWVLDADKPFAV